ncbi:MAG: hypothetical protein LZF62_430212 [Nitrospira sp.]|nr:MAG: hypothetical protein LZF62_430212 [Nitrospira sp.]
MTNGIHLSRTTRQPDQASLLCVFLVFLLVTIRLVAGTICYTCLPIFEAPKSRTAHFHGGKNHASCHQDRVNDSLWLVWACTVTQDESAYILPEIPRLPVVISLFAALFLLAVSYGGRTPVATPCRGPPVSPHIF